jgi:hypothetical protein
MAEHADAPASMFLPNWLLGGGGPTRQDSKAGVA